MTARRTRRALLLGIGRMGAPYLDAAHRRGLAVSLVESRSRLAAADTRARLRAEDRTYAVSASLDQAWYEAASTVLADTPVDAVVAFSDPQVVAAALVADELRLPSPGLHAAQVSRDKALQRVLFLRHGLPQPDFHVARSAEDAIRWASGRYPVVGKPVGQAGSLGVRLLRDDAELRAWLDDERPSPPYLVERYLGGPEFSCEVLVLRGAVVFTSLTEKVTSDPPYFVELEHHVPARCEEDAMDAVSELARRVVSVLGMSTGIMHLELRLEPSGPHVLEVAVRSPGDFIMDLVRLARGVDLFAAALAVACGEEPDVAVRRREAACAWFPSARPGTIRAIEGLDAVERQEGFVRAAFVPPGTRLRPLRSSLDRCGTLLLAAPDRNELDRRLKLAKSTLVVATDPTP